MDYGKYTSAGKNCSKCIRKKRFYYGGNAVCQKSYNKVIYAVYRYGDKEQDDSDEGANYK